MTKTLFLLFLFFCHSLSAQVNLTQGLVAYYPFSGNSNDVSGNNINGIVTNATLTTDRNGITNSAYYFDGATSYIRLPYSNLYNFAPQDSFSISLWVLPDQGYSWPAQALVVKSPSNPDFTLSNWNYGTYILNYKAMTGFAANNFLNGNTIFTNTSCWYNIIVTYKNGIWKLYVNGVLEASDISQTKFILQDGPASTIAFGKKGESFGDWYKGKMDEVRIYDRVLNSDEIAALYGPGCKTPCNNWLQTQAIGQSVTVGDLDVSGNQMTIEANFSCTSFPLSGANLWEDIVSKHSNTTDANYVLRMDLAAITTTTGHYLLSPVCNNLTLNKIFHVALVYNGSTLKFYRNGFLLGQMPVTGNLILNDWMTTIGDYAVNNPVGTNFFGYINEVRIWNVAKTQAELRTYMNTSLPNPTTQPGLLGYYTFDNLLNKQGNPAYNGTLNGGATINNTVPDCTFIPDSCQTPCDTNHDFSFQQSACNPLSINFQSAVTTYDSIGWDFNDGNVLSNNSNPTHLYANGGNYIVKMIVNNGTCIDTVTKSISINALQVNDLIKTNDTTLCSGGQVQINTTGALTYIWSPATGLSNSNIPNPLASPLSTTKYFVTGTDLNGCASRDSILININPKPAITKSNDVLICKNSSTQLFATGGITYSWSPSATLNDPNISNPIATTSVSTEYYVTVFDANSCSNIDSVMVNIRPDPVFTISPDIYACENSSAQLNATGGDIYAWQPTASLSNSNISNPIATAATTTNYSVQITDTICNNTANLNTTVTVLPLPIVQASKSNDIDCATDASQLNASGGIKYTWSPAQSLDNPNIQNPIARPIATTQYSVKVEDASGCSNTDTITVYVTGLNKGDYLMSNAFTPNHDGKNDCYGIKYWGVILELDFSIYNRWGQRIFHTNQPGQCWDGTFNGKPQNSDVYIYMIKAKTFCDQEIFRKGTFTLIR